MARASWDRSRRQPSDRRIWRLLKPSASDFGPARCFSLIASAALTERQATGAALRQAARTSYRSGTPGKSHTVVTRLQGAPSATTMSGRRAKPILGCAYASGNITMMYHLKKETPKTKPDVFRQPTTLYLTAI